ncbi:MAG: molybdopterin cofactor-binding domain-containing protein [Pseudomonadota bacterium]
MRVADWLTVEGGRLVIATGKVDLGQRISTALARIAGEELGLAPAEVTVAPVVTGHSPDEGITSGSLSVEQSGAAVRAAAIAAREALVVLAAEELATAALVLEDGLIRDPASNRSLRLLDLWPRLPADLEAEPGAAPGQGPVRPPAAGAPLGMAEMVRGTHVFVQDLAVEGMLHARTVRPPHERAILEALDEATVAALRDAGIHVVIEDRFLAVAASGEWQAIRAAARLGRACTWGGEGLAEGDAAEMLTTLPARRLAIRPGGEPSTEDPIPEPLADATHRVELHRPYTMHAALAPSAALARLKDGRLAITTHSQGIYPLRSSMAEALGMAEDAIEITHAPGSGCYGHNGADDAAFDAALVALAIPGRPVLLKWTREEEHAWEPYGPAALTRLAARLEHGRIAAFEARAYSDTHRGRPRPGPDAAGPRRLISARLRGSHPPYVGEPNMNRHGGMHRNLDPIYAVGERRMTKTLVTAMPLRTSALRTLGATLNTGAIESLMDMMAETSGQDPLAFRRAHLDDPRDRAVLDRLAKVMGPPAEGRGIGFARYKNKAGRVGASADLDVDETATIRLRRLVLVAEAGRIVDRDGLIAQIEGGAVQAASWALHERVTWDRDGVTSTDWDSYPVIRFSEIPAIETHLIDVPDAPSLGAGEVSCGPVLGAILNALAAATGLRPNRLPLTPETLRAAALED